MGRLPFTPPAMPQRTMPPRRPDRLAARELSGRSRVEVLPADCPMGLFPREWREVTDMGSDNSRHVVPNPDGGGM